MMGAIRRFRGDRRGGVAVTFAAMLPLMLSGMALAIDYANFRLTHTRMQTAVDAAAVSALWDKNANKDEIVAKARELVEMNLPEGYGEVTRVTDVKVGKYNSAGGFVVDSGAGANAVRVVAERSVARGNAVQRIFSIFISRDDLTIRTVATAARPSNVFYEPPEITVLSSSAHDFNELYAYCYDPIKKTQGQMKLIANNNKRTDRTLYPAGDANGLPANSVPANSIQVPSTSNWPNCTGEGESVSFRLRNFRSANVSPNTLWTTQKYNYDTNTKLTDGVESSMLFGKDKMVETRRCDSRDKCNPDKPNNDIGGGEGISKVPNVENRACAPGKFMYYGWEDRPPTGSSDRDYNDITILLRCPAAGALGGGKPRLVG